jgi:hypothetical protein
MRRWLVYWHYSVSEEAYALHKYFNRTSSKARKITFAALLGALAAIFQSAGGFMPGVGYFISPLATAPIILSTIYSIRSGLQAYLLTIVLLMIIQPSEIIVFPFTTGVLGFGIGVGFLYLNKRITVIALGSFSLFTGIITLLYLFRFPVLGSSIDSSFSILYVLPIYLFSFLYGWLWVEISRVYFRKFRNIVD